MSYMCCMSRNIRGPRTLVYFKLVYTVYTCIYKYIYIFMYMYSKIRESKIDTLRGFI